MLLEQHLAQLFANLPYLPMLEITKHLSHFQILKIAAVSGSWSREIRIPRGKMDLLMSLTLITGENYAEIFILGFGEKLWIRIVVEPGADRNNEFELRTNQSIIWKCENLEILQERLLDMVNRLRPVMHSLLFWEVNWNFDFGFSVKFLKSLNIRKVWNFNLKAKTTRICGAELDRVLEGIKVSRLRFNVETIRKMRGGVFYLRRNVQIEMEDSRWVTGGALNEHFDCQHGYFKKSRLTSQDLNRFLKIWKAGKKEKVKFLEFQLEKPIDKAEVIKGLDAKSWDPKLRSRRKQENYDVRELFEIYDLADGLDIRAASGTLGTVFVSENRKLLRFHVWTDGNLFPIVKLRKQCAEMVKFMDGMLKVNNLSDLDREYYESEKQAEMRKLRKVREALKNGK